MTGYAFARLLSLIAGTLALNCAGSAAQHLADVTQTAQPGRIENGAALALDNLPVHAPCGRLPLPIRPPSSMQIHRLPVTARCFFGNRYGNASAVALDESTGKTRRTSAPPVAARL